jgi:transcriptional regulator with XRE-family HTH domain
MAVAESATQGERLRELRTERHLSIRELAHFAGVAHTTIARLEHGDIDVSASIKCRISRALGVAVDFWPVEE